MDNGHLDVFLAQSTDNLANADTELSTEYFDNRPFLFEGRNLTLTTC